MSRQLTLDGLLLQIRMRESALRKFGVDRLYIFGSYARGIAGDESDIDVLVHFPKGHRGGYFAMARIKIALEDALGVKVDVQLENAGAVMGRFLEGSARAF